MSSGTQVFQAGPRCTAAAPEAAVRSGGGRGRRFGRGLWSLLHAPALLNGTAGGRGDVAVVEDDYHRLAGRRNG
jgi:hypothetical protein